MQVNRPVWDVYKPGPATDINFAGTYVDPMYQPYQPQYDPRTGEYANAAAQDTLLRPEARGIYPQLIRRGWGLNFQKMISYDPCPPGWEAAKSPDGRDSGWCRRQEQYITPIFYSPLGKAGKTRTYVGYAPREWDAGVPRRSNYGFVNRQTKYGVPGFSTNYIGLDAEIKR